MREIFQKNAKPILLSILSYRTNILTGFLLLWFQLSFIHSKLKKIFKMYRTCNFYRYSKSGIFQEISKADQIFPFKWKVRVFEFAMPFYMSQDKFKFRYFIRFDHFRFLSTKFEPLQKANDKITIFEWNFNVNHGQWSNCTVNFTEISLATLEPQQQ